MGRIVLNRDKCKACYLCIDACPNKVLEIDKEVNALGYYPAQVKENANCVGCAIEKVYR